MTDLVGSLRSERWLDEILIVGSVANLDGDGNLYLAMPAGITHVAIIEAMIDVSPLATVRTNIELAGCRWTVDRISDDQIQDLIGVERWSLRGAAAASTYVSPDPLVEWKDTERVHAVYPELDTNAVPTGDVVILVKCVRIPASGVVPATGPIRLVR